MAALYSNPHSPWEPDRASLRAHVGNPMTPVHSPHHSLASSASSRTPIHTLTIHEYRKQQHTPTLARKGTPPGKTLRRKPAALALNDIERAATVPPSTHSDYRPSQRCLHFSQSAHQLKQNPLPFQQQAQPELPFRAQTTEPHQHTGSISSLSTASSSSKVRYFNSRKRLPRPPATTGLVTAPHPNANVKSAQARQPRPPTLNLSAEHTRSVNVQATTPPPLALSRFPTPPYQVASPLSPLQDESEFAHLNPQSFATTKPATPPATPAIIHYRGTSFDLVNPRDSLLLHDIVTPSRDFDSGEYFAVPTSDDEFPEMAPKRAVYGDFRTAHAGILRRAGDSPGRSDADLPLPPTPTALSPNSSSYTSPMYSVDSADIPSPLFAKSPPRESRFSLKGLTRSLTQRLGKSPEQPQDEELYDMRKQNVSSETIRMDLGYPRPLNLPGSTPDVSYAPVGTMSPITPTSPASPKFFPAFSPGQHEDKTSQEYSAGRYEIQPLASMVPDDYSAQTRRNDASQPPFSEDPSLAKSYSDNVDATNRSSSIYTGDDRRFSYQYGIRSKHNNHGNPFAGYGNTGPEYLADEPNPYTVSDYADPSDVVHQSSRPYNPAILDCLTDQADPEADATSALISEYSPHSPAGTTSHMLQEGTAVAQDPTPKVLGEDRDASGVGSHQQLESAASLDEPEFDMHQASSQNAHASSSARSKFSQSSGVPPHAVAPLAPAWDYEGSFIFPTAPGISGITVPDSTNSYRDTQDLLQVSPYGTSMQPDHLQKLEPSSSYSQPELEPLGPFSSHSRLEAGPAEPSPSSRADSHASNIPQETLDHAEQIFQDTGDQNQSNEGIPAMWSRRQSGSQLLAKSVTNRSSLTSRALTMPLYDVEGAVPQDRADWETLGGNSGESIASLDSIANYSSSEGSQGGGICLNSGGLVTSWVNQPQSPARSNYYYHPSPIGPHPHPFRSSPPELNLNSGMGTPLDTSSSPLASQQFASRTTQDTQNSVDQRDTLKPGTADQQSGALPRGTDPYAFSDKETEELLASGPNDNIIIDERLVHQTYQPYMHQQRENQDPTSKASFSGNDISSSSPTGLGCQNTLEPLATVTSRNTLPRTSGATSSRKTGSNVANTVRSSVRLNAGSGQQRQRSEYSGFYAAPFLATGSVTRISLARRTTGSKFHRSPSETSLFPSSRSLRESQELWPSGGHSQNLKNSTTFTRGSRRTSRSAVHSQTRLREMYLAPDVRSVTSSRTNITHFMVGGGGGGGGGGNRPSTSNTITPLCSSYPTSLGIPPAVSQDNMAHSRITIAHRYSPRLLCVERKPNAEDEARRRQLSWIIFAGFCILPPCIILFRFFGDDIIASMTEGHLGYCTPQSKRMAVIAGIAVNIGLVTAIIVPLLILHALGRI